MYFSVSDHASGALKQVYVMSILQKATSASKKNRGKHTCETDQTDSGKWLDVPKDYLLLTFLLPVEVYQKGCSKQVYPLQNGQLNMKSLLLKHLAKIIQRLQFDLAMKSNDLTRALACLLTMSNSRDVGREIPAQTPGPSFDPDHCSSKDDDTRSARLPTDAHTNLFGAPATTDKENIEDDELPAIDAALVANTRTRDPSMQPKPKWSRNDGDNQSPKDVARRPFSNSDPN